MKISTVRSKLSVRSRARSLRYAFSGLRDMLFTEPNAWVHAAMTCLALFFSWWFRIGRIKFALVVVAIVAVWVAEAFNTVLEILMDFVAFRQYSPIVKRAKDISAAAVLIASIGAIAIGVTVFGRPIFEQISELSGILSLGTK